MLVKVLFCQKRFYVLKRLKRSQGELPTFLISSFIITLSFTPCIVPIYIYLRTLFLKPTIIPLMILLHFCCGLWQCNQSVFACFSN